MGLSAGVLALLAVANGAAPFKLTQGKGVEVCEAYEGLLNRAHYDVDPFCGRPNSDPSSGFVEIPRRDLNAAEILPLFNYVHAFMQFNDQAHVERTYHPNGADPAKSYWSTDLSSQHEIAELLGLHYIHVWTFDAPIDLDNDGTSRRILLWQGYGAEDDGASCGGQYPSKPWNFPYIRQRAFVLTPDGKKIDAPATRAIFGATGAASTQGKPFRALADSVGIFRYGDRYYLDTENIPDRPTGGTVIVYERESGHTRRLCTLR